MGAPSYSKSLLGEVHPDPDRLADLLRGTDRDTLRFLTCGSVDDGKSTLIGRLFHETGHIPDDHMAALTRDSRRFGTVEGELDFALLVDGLEDERQQGITIDVAYRYVGTPRRSFVIADTPGHEQYTRNMATGASQCDLAVILVDARSGILAQTKRHAGICSLLGIRSVVLAVNKMDLVDFDQAVFEGIVAAFRDFSARLAFDEIAAIPLSARHGDNVTAPSGRMPWFTGSPLLAHLETVRIDDRRGGQPLRLPVQWVSRPEEGGRLYAGTVASGLIRAGETLRVAGSGRQSRVVGIAGPQGEVGEAGPGEAITVSLADEVDIARGDLLCRPDAPPQVADQFAAHLLWMADEPLLAGRQYLLRIGMKEVAATITTIRHKLDIETLGHLAADTVASNEIAVCNLATAEPVAFDPYGENRATGSFILIDRYSNDTIGAGMIDFALMRAGNIHAQKVTVDKAARGGLTRQRPAIVWFTGFSGSGKSTIADLVERRLHAGGHLTYLLDGDNVRRSLNRDLGFTDADRVENIRRVGEVARLFVDAGLVVLCAFISPFASERQAVRELVGPGEFFEIFVDTPLELCMARDPKRIYAGARQGGIRNVTGLDSPYEAPIAPDLRLETAGTDPDTLADRVVRLLQEHRIIGR